MSEAFKKAEAAIAHLPTPNIEDFLDYAKTNFVELSLLYGEVFVVHAVHIAELLLEAETKCSQCGCMICECGEYE